MHLHGLVLSSLLSLAACSSPASSPSASAPVSPSPPPASLAVVHVLAFDGVRAIPDATVLVDESHIVAVTPRGAVPPGARVVDGNGKTLLPGLIDAHLHIQRAQDLGTLAMFGVTTALDMFAPVAIIKEAKSAAQTTPGIADLRSAGILATAPGGHGTEYGLDISTLTRPEEADAFVAARVAEGSDYLKIVFDDASGYGFHNPTLSIETVRALVVAAHRRRLLVVAHIGTQEGARAVIEAGVDGLAHTFEDSAPSPDFASLVKAHHAFVIPTLAVDASAAGAVGELGADPSLAPFLTVQAKDNLARVFPPSPGSRLRYSFAEASVAAVHAAGVPLLAGTDAAGVANPGTVFGASMHDELARLVHAGLTATEALVAATSAPAAAFGLTDRGRLAAGLRADLLLVEGDATRDILATRHIARVWIEGVEVDRAAYRKEVDAERERDAAVPASVIAGPVSDFETTTLDTQLGAPWTSISDTIPGGHSQASVKRVAGGAHGSLGAMEVSGVIRAGFRYPFAGATLRVASSGSAPADVSQKKGITFRVKGDGRPARFYLYTASGGWQPAIQTFPVAKVWHDVHLTFADFKTDGHDVVAVAVAGGPALGAFRFLVDDVAFE